MISGMILAAMLQSGQPMVAACAVTPEGLSRNRSVPRSLAVDCPDDVTDAAQLQDRAEAAVGRIPLNLHRRIDLRFAPQVWFQWSREDGWRAVPEQAVVVAFNGPEERIVFASYTRQDCVFASWPDEDGVPQEVEIHCLLDGGRSSRMIRSAERNISEAIENYRYLPADEPYCISQEVRWQFSNAGFRTGYPDNEVPLPDLCPTPAVEPVRTEPGAKGMQKP